MIDPTSEYFITRVDATLTVTAILVVSEAFRRCDDAVTCTAAPMDVLQGCHQRQQCPGAPRVLSAKSLL